jgi:hypothetical protein
MKENDTMQDKYAPNRIHLQHDRDAITIEMSPISQHKLNDENMTTIPGGGEDESEMESIVGYFVQLFEQAVYREMAGRDVVSHETKLLRAVTTNTVQDHSFSTKPVVVDQIRHQVVKEFDDLQQSHLQYFSRKSHLFRMSTTTNRPLQYDLGVRQCFLTRFCSSFDG